MNDELFYKAAADEVRAGNIKEGLWIKCVVQADGDEHKAKINYIKIRVEQLKAQEVQRQIKSGRRHPPGSLLAVIEKFFDAIFGLIFFWVKPKE